MKNIVRTRLIEARKRRLWSQQELADLLNTTQNNVSRWERGITTPNPYFRARLCALFEQSAQELGLVDENQSLSANVVGKAAEASSSSEVPALWTVPYARNPHFTGRDELLEQLDRYLAPAVRQEPATTCRAALTQAQAIKGLGGIGKTQIAVEYAHRAQERNRYTHTLWIDAANEETLRTSFVALADLLPAFSAQNQTNQLKLMAEIKRWLEECQERWLLIFDNADEISLLQTYLPQRGNGSLLFTTRANAVGSLAISLNVDNMGLIEGTTFLLQRAQRQQASDEERNEAINIVIALDGFPLALDQAGAYIEETGCSFHDYLQAYEKHRQQMLARRGRQATSYPDSVATTWSLSFHKVAQANPAATELLQLCAFLAPDRIPEELLKDGAPYWPPALQEAAADLFSFNNMLEDLLAFSLVKRLVEDHLLSIHRLVQAVLKDLMEPEMHRKWAERVINATNSVFPGTVEPTSWSRCQRFLPQAQVCNTFIQEYAFTFVEAASLLLRTASYLRDIALYEQALPLLQQTVQIREHLFGPNHLELADPLNRLAWIYLGQGKHEQGEELSKRALSIREQALSPDHPDIASSLEGLATALAEQGKYTEAEPLFQRAIRIWEQARGVDCAEIASLLDSLAIISTIEKKYTEAEAIFQRALRIREQTLGHDHPDIAASLNNLASLYQDQGKYEQAEPLTLRAIQIWEEKLGPNHIYLSYPLYNLADIYSGQGKQEQAMALFQRCLSLQEQTFGPENARTIETRERLQALLEASNQTQS